MGHAMKSKNPNNNKRFLTSSHWGSYRVETQDGEIKKVFPFERDQDPSLIGQALIDVINDETRITQPMVRKSWLESKRGINTDLRGEDVFIPLDWDDAIRVVGDELSHVMKHHGNASIFAGSYGWASAGRFHHAQSQIHRFLNTIGGYTRSVNTYSFAAAEVIFPHIVGDFRSFLYKQTS